MLSLIKHFGINLNKGIRYQHFYTKNHEIINFVEKDVIRIGISNYAKKSLGNIVFIEANEIETLIEKEEEIAILESVKATGSINAPEDGIVIAHNEELINEPNKFNKTPNELDSWILEYKLNNKIDKTELLTSLEYDNFLNKE